ncbi:MAG: RdgB/HAM1 family non-canonical purine NTP pyrophosphatase [Betaproteobacteria bacterium]|nr:RdgB/HAM1 family non-canonical purine NTP pyrophosphatase [Betaproteobacteria bacterium]
MIKRLVLASKNPGKLRELQALLQSFELTVIPQDDLDIQEAPEPHFTFVENALAKARNAALHSELPALADDSGLCVNALGGAPGVISAHYAGEPRSDLRNNQKLVFDLQGVEDRRAHYYCVLVLVRFAQDPEPLITEGRWDGEIILSPRGQEGFGYDPYFYLPERGCTAAELAIKDKNRVSHRAQALAQLLVRLRTNALV